MGVFTNPEIQIYDDSGKIILNNRNPGTADKLPVKEFRHIEIPLLSPTILSKYSH